ncbi:RagB/SusD family nutrient uptake outer membrane protein [Niabella yanshanensis]|uniref:RagB/SusD family nutrient uptake outer membrane protein n=1 Tax=Niabella yanshanensis TaxID=577386 RepID=A0ABZ0W0Y5_9BACT|nr:RagB/SusD family nutrient uptake outer membrane protein [Niabella yanshanensis]WQD36736.1 RagB/SusD family nutrient uptake outer membrane protein [Niabella yanshanensis]
MKTRKYIIIIIVVTSIFFPGCSKYLDRMPDDQLTLDMIFSDKIRMEDWLAGVYQGIPSPMWGYMKDQGFSIMGDDMCIPEEWRPFGWQNVHEFTIGNWHRESPWNPNYWVELPKRIRSGLIFIENAKPQPEKGLTQEIVDRMKNEARFLNAYYYWLMVEVYGPIPFKPGVITPNDAPSAELMIAQSPVDSVVNWIDTELKDVSTKLPATYSGPLLGENYGRATSIMALAVRARMLLHAASPLLNGNPDYTGVVNKNGTALFGGSYDAGKWTRAAQAHKELIDAATAAGHHLYIERNNDGSVDPFMSYYNMSLKRYSEGNTEILFDRPNNWDLNIWQYHHLPIGIGGNGALGVTQELVDAFFTKNGLPISDPASGYSESGFSTAGEVRNTKWRGAEGPNRIAGQVTMPGTYNMYCNREPRFYVSVLYNEAWLGVDNRRAEFFYGSRDNNKTFDSPQNGYEVRKRVGLEIFPRNNVSTYQPGILYRLAEAYLGYAEALNESNPGNPDILKYINLVRERAGIPGLTGGSQQEIREAIQRERRVEFNCEGVRIHDLRRWKLAERDLNKDMMGMNFFGTKKSSDAANPNAFYKRTFNMRRSFSKKMYLWPVPQTEIDKNPNLTQMPGY